MTNTETKTKEFTHLFETSRNVGPERSRETWFVEDILNISTDDAGIDELLAEASVSILKSLQTNITRIYGPDYDKGTEMTATVLRYTVDLLLMNSPFFTINTSIGTSIRSSFWNPSRLKIEIPNAVCRDGYSHRTYEKTFYNLEDWKEFINELIEYVEGN